MKRHIQIFNKIAFIYQWFFNFQVKSYLKIIKGYNGYLNIDQGDKVLDIGCGTGAFAYSLQKHGYHVTGIDAAPTMVKYGRENDVSCIEGDVIEGLSFADNAFDLVTAAYVAHGLDNRERIKLFEEAKRLSRDQVLFHDYNQNDYFLIDIIEYLEGGNYFSFKKNAITEMEKVFNDVNVISIGLWNNWYLCR